MYNLTKSTKKHKKKINLSKTNKHLVRPVEKRRQTQPK